MSDVSGRGILVGSLLFRIGFVLAFALTAMLHAIAQIPDGHAEHHPTAPVAPPSPSQSAPPLSPNIGNPPAAPMVPADLMGMMREMMGIRAPKEFYPTLMSLPALAPEHRQTIEAQARAWISIGIDEIASAESDIRHAMAARDAASAEQAAQRLRQALNQVSSGTAVLQALTAGKHPQQIAQDWFKEQLNLTTGAPAQPREAPFDLSWFHLITMSLLTAFAGGMLAIYFFRMRRANALVSRLTSTPEPRIPHVVAPLQSTTAASVPAQRNGLTTPAPSVPQANTYNLAPPTVSTPARGGLWKGQLRVASIFRETPLVKTFRLRDPQGRPIPFTFSPGQFLTFSAEIDRKRVRRSYTIASSAAQTAYVECTIKREVGGVFSDYMHDKVIEGDLVEVTGPSGVFTFRGTEADSLVLIGGGVGITPLMAVIRYLADISWPREIFLVYGARSTEEFIFREELEYRQRRIRNLHVAATMRRSAGTAWMGAEGPITKEFLTQSVPDIAKRHIHLCGPPGMMEAMKKILAELGLPATQVMTEAFGPAMGAVPPPGFTEVTAIEPPAGLAADAVPEPSITSAHRLGPASATIRFSRSNKDVPLPPDKTVLEVAESAGVPIDYQCRVGTCGVCKVQLLEGKVSMEVEEALTPEDKAQNIILACQAKSIGNLVVEV